MPSLVEICPVVLEKKIFKYFQYNLTFSLLSPLGKGRDPSLEETWIPPTQVCFVPSLVEIGPVVLEKRLKMWKVYRRTDTQMHEQTKDNMRSKKLTWAFSSGELKELRIELCNPFPRIDNPISQIINSFPEIRQSVLSCCNSFPRFQQSVILVFNSFPRFQQSVILL